MIDPKYADVVEALYAYMRSEDFGDEEITTLSKPIGLAYTDIYREGANEPWCSMQVSVHIPSMTFLYTNDWTGEVYGRDRCQDLDEVRDYLNAMTFQGYYETWLDFARKATGIDDLC